MPESTGAIGMKMRGMYTFVMSGWLSTKLRVELVSALTKRSHGTSAVKVSTE